jgi:hypothetical protein
LFLSSCGAKRPFYERIQDKITEIPHNEIDHEVVIIGNIGQRVTVNDGITELVKKELDSNIERTIVFNGNFLTMGGYVPKKSENYKNQVQLLKNCISTFEQLSNVIYFVPSENEWGDTQSSKLQSVIKSQHLVEEVTEKMGVVLPDLGCAVSDAIDIGVDLVVVFVNSTWMLNQYELDQEKDPVCDLNSYIDASSKIQSIVADNKLKNIIIVTHHPIFSTGETAGNYSAISHLKPIPIVGTVKNGLKKIIGGKNHFGNPNYEKYRKAMLSGIRNCEGCAIVTSFENNLQYQEKNLNHYVNSGIADEVDYVKRGGDNSYASQKLGFSKFIHTKDRGLWIEINAFHEDCSCFKIEYQKKIFQKPPLTKYELNIKDSPRVDSVTIHASNKYGKKGFGTSEGYRKSWGSNIKVPNLWLEQEGMTVVKSGGGDQTLSLRLVDKDKAQFVIRSIDKNVDKLVDPDLRNTFVKTSIQGGISSSHPYGALVIPKLADAINILHTIPKLVYVSEQKLLGDYNENYANSLYLMEQRPAGNIAKHKIFGDAEKSLSTVKMINLLHKGKGNIDQKELVRCRLFDMLIGDWDRHDDQWRWLRYEDDSGEKYYRPMPRDRDQVFFKNKAFGSYIPTRPFFNPGLRSFEDEIDFISGVNFNARHFDRTFLNGLTVEDFITEAELIQNNITDEVLQAAFLDWPQVIRENDAEEIISKLQARRIDLKKYAEEYYKYLYEEVDIVGTDGKDDFELDIQNKTIEINVYSESKKGKNLIYSQSLDLNQTKEIRLFGLEDDDSFKIRGEGNNNILRIIGGDGNDTVYNTSKLNKVLVYDVEDDIKIIGNYKDKTSIDPMINVYDRKDYKLNRSLLYPLFTLYTDEGIGISLKYDWKRHNFRSGSYKSNNRLSLNYYGRLNSFIHYFNGHIKSVFGKWDFKPSYRITAPTFIQYYYGLGNEYVAPELLIENELNPSVQNFVVQGSSLNLFPTVSRKVSNSGALNLGLGFKYINFKESNSTRNLFYLSENSGLTGDDLNSAYYGNINASYNEERIDNSLNPRRGYKYRLSASYHVNLDDRSGNHLKLESDIQMYIPLGSSPNVILSTDLGFKYNLGDYEFFNANYLAGDRRLRGFWSDRFGGDGYVYQSTDLRIKVKTIGKSIPTNFGLYGSFDYGRTFLQNENNSDWHTSFGGGIYFAPLDIIGFRMGYHTGASDGQIKLFSSLRI